MNHRGVTQRPLTRRDVEQLFGVAAALDLLRHVPGDGDHGVLVGRGDSRARAADRGARFAEDDEALRPAAIKAIAAKVVEEREPKSMNHRPFRELTKDFSPERRERIEAIKARMREEDRHAAVACSPPRRNAAPSPFIVQSSGAS